MVLKSPTPPIQFPQEPTPTLTKDASSVSAIEAGSGVRRCGGCNGAEAPGESRTPDRVGEVDPDLSSAAIGSSGVVVNFDAITCPAFRSRPCRCLDHRAARHVIRPDLPLFDTDPDGDAA
jgi:hypothetical protein